MSRMKYEYCQSIRESLLNASEATVDAFESVKEIVTKVNHPEYFGYSKDLLTDKEEDDIVGCLDETAQALDDVLEILSETRVALAAFER